MRIAPPLASADYRHPSRTQLALLELLPALSGLMALGITALSVRGDTFWLLPFTTPLWLVFAISGLGWLAQGRLPAGCLVLVGRLAVILALFIAALGFATSDGGQAGSPSKVAIALACALGFGIVASLASALAIAFWSDRKVRNAESLF